MQTGQKLLMINLPPSGIILGSQKDSASSRYINPPLGIFYLISRLKEKVENIKLLDYNLLDYDNLTDIYQYEELIEKELVHVINDFIPNVIGISLMFSSSYNFFQLLIQLVKKIIPNSIIICGGIHASNTVAQILDKHKEVDYLVCGEGEETFPHLLQMIKDGKPIDLKGVHRCDNIRYLPNNKPEFTDLVDSLDINYSDYSSYVDLEPYISGFTEIVNSPRVNVDNYRTYSLMASRGCPVSCIFCAASTVHGKKARWRNISNIKDEIMDLYRKHAINKIQIFDDNFVPKQKAMELFEMLADISACGIEIVIVNMSVNHTDNDMIDMIAKVGIKNLAFAIESGSAEVQKKIKKYCNLDKVFELVKYAQSKDIFVKCFFIIGFPGETVDQMRDTITFAKRIKADFCSISVATPFAGTEMYDEFLALGYIKDLPEFWNAKNFRMRLFDTKEISAGEITFMAYEAGLELNFVNNRFIETQQYEKGEVFYLNFLKTYDFHIFAMDALRRIYNFISNKTKEHEILQMMIYKIKTSEKSRDLLKYRHLLDDDCVKALRDANCI